MVRRRIVIPATDSEDDGHLSPSPPPNLFGEEEESESESGSSFPPPQQPQALQLPTASEQQNSVDPRTRLRTLLEGQRKLLPQHKQSPVLFRRRGSRSRASFDMVEPFSSKRESWESMVNQITVLDGDFFDSPEGRMEENTEKKRGTVVYSGLRMDVTNSFDLETVFDVKFRSKVVFRKRKSQPFDGLRCTAGQFMRFVIAIGLVGKDIGYQKNILFQALSDTEAVQCNHLLTIINVAIIRLREAKDIEAKLQMVAKYLRSVAAESKRAGRRNRRRQRLIDISEKNHTLLFDADLRKALSIAKHKLKDIMNTYVLDEAKEVGSFTRRLGKNEDLLHKWFLNFLAAIAFSCGGQRPQAIASLQLPSVAELDRVESTAFGDFFSLRCNSDKRERDASFPSVLFPISMKQFVEFHKRVMRAYLREKLSFVDEGVDVRLLMHSREGTCLCTRQITHSLRTFMINISRRYEFVTSMVVRASFATSMMHAYSSGRIGKDLAEKEFLELLGKRMNTSAEQLLSAYIHIGRVEYEKGVKVAMEHFLVVMEEDEEEEEDE
ncbi:hypothetical protein FGB62_181g01 [Gracilaria domingensis]|nr:hypothetical protein FGB62_181g01 [Gracilaria domingensis]